MRIRNAGRGIHRREIPGIEKLLTLPNEWYGYTNLELSLSVGESRETDAFLVIEDRILLVDLKDWNGKIESDEGRWFLDNRNMGPSPVEKVRSNARKIAEVLKSHLREKAKKQGLPVTSVFVPLFQGCVVLTARADITGISGNERSSVFFVDDFVKKLAEVNSRIALLGPVRMPDQSLIERNGYWRKELGDFFNVQTGPFRPRQRRYGNYTAVTDASVYRHRATSPESSIYQEYDVEENAPARSPGLLRVWDFSRASVRFQTEEGRREVAGREREVIAYLKDRNPEFDTALLQPRDADYERSVTYWEIFERRRQLKRLRDLNVSSTFLTDVVRIDLARGLIARLKTMHDVDATHLDLGPHSVWIELPSSVKLSHLFAASYPTLQSLGEHRYQFLTAGWQFPEDLFGDKSDHKRRDVFLMGAIVHQIIFGKPPRSADGSPPEWDVTVDTEGHFSALYAWFQSALSWDVSERFPDAGEALLQFNAALEQRADGRSTQRELERFRLWDDQLELFESLPREEEWLKRSDRVNVWKSTMDGEPVIVKLWKRTCWSDDRREASRLLSFLKKAEAMIEAPIEGTAQIVKAAFLLDSLVLVQKFVDGLTLDRDLTTNLHEWRDCGGTLSFLHQLASAVTTLHDAHISHGDLKPANIIVSRSNKTAPQAVLVDICELEAVDDGDIVTTAYAPPSGAGRFERDRFAVTKIAEEIIAVADISGEIGVDPVFWTQR